jgi:RNA polymerase sigma-70 factor (ECF subfamily)
MGNYSDNEMMLSVKNGDPNKLGLLFERYKEPLFGYFYRNTHQRELSEDLLQNVFLRILKYRERFDGSGQFKSWIYTIAHHVLADNYKRKGADYRYFDSDFHDSDNLPDFMMQKQESIQLLYLSMFRIKPEERELLILSRYQGLRYKEIAHICNTNEGTIKVRIFRALQSLRDVYKELEK